MNILLVDDEEVVLKSLGRFLTRCGHRLRTAPDGVEALRCVEEETPDVVISDVRMSDVDGLDLLERVKGRFPSLPVVLITGHWNREVAASARRKGVYDCLRKPVRIEDLMAVLERVKEGERDISKERSK